jgi:3-oxoacyl-[acyl-carrier protein] reductase
VRVWHSPTVGGEGAALATDIRVENEVKALFKAVDKQFGPADIVVNNAGILRDAMTVLLTAADWNDVLITNLTGTFLVCKAALSRMSRRRSGSIVNIGSVIGTMGGLGQANYSASKAALVGLTKSLAREGAKRGVRVNLVVPGAIATAMTAHLVAGHAGGAAAESIIPLQRLGRPADVAHLVSFVASELGSYMTGTMLTVDGGLSM